MATPGHTWSYLCLKSPTVCCTEKTVDDLKSGIIMYYYEHTEVFVPFFLCKAPC